jgi:hypothetical protein
VRDLAHLIVSDRNRDKEVIDGIVGDTRDADLDEFGRSISS